MSLNKTYSKRFMNNGYLIEIDVFKIHVQSTAREIEFLGINANVIRTGANHSPRIALG